MQKHLIGKGKIINQGEKEKKLKGKGTKVKNVYTPRGNQKQYQRYGAVIPHLCCLLKTRN